MASLNKIILIGNLTAEPELRYLQGSNTAICEFSIAINNKYRSNGGQTKEEVCFVEIVVWGKQGENCNRHLQKGSSVFVDGRLVYETWTERDTQKKRSRLRVIAEKVQYISGTRQIVESQSVAQTYQTHPGINAHKYPKADIPQYDMPDIPENPMDDTMPIPY